MTSDGSSYARFSRALKTGNLRLVRITALELPRVALDDALSILALIAEKDPRVYEPAAVRFAARLSGELADLGLETLGLAVDALCALEDDARAVDDLRAIVRGTGR